MHDALLTMEKLRIEYIPLSKASSLIFSQNPKKHDLGAIATSISRYGFKDPPKFEPLLNGGDGGIVEGNGRIETLDWMRSQGQPIPGGIVTDENGEWYVPVLFGVDADSEKAASAYAIDHNNLVLSGGDFTALDAARLWDSDEYLQLLQSLDDELPVTVDDDDLSLLLQQLGEGFEGRSAPSDSEDEQTTSDLIEQAENGAIECRFKPGDIIQLGRHRIACGDSTDEGNVRKLLGDRFGKVDMVFTDPPYNVAYQGKSKHQSRTTADMTIKNDAFASSGDFLVFLKDYFSAVLAACVPGAAIYVCHADAEGENFRRALRESGWLYKQSLVWVKNSLVLGRQDYHWKHEPILYGWKPGASHNWYSDRSQTTVWEFDRPTASREHPTMKPLDLVQYALSNSSASSDIVYDGFLGSGSTILAAQKMEGHRIVYGFELSPEYIEVICRRFEEFTGTNAELFGHL